MSPFEKALRYAHLATEYLEILTDELVDVAIYSIDGQVLLKMINISGNDRIAIHEIPNGTYVVNICGNDKEDLLTSKLIIK